MTPAACFCAGAGIVVLMWVSYAAGKNLNGSALPAIAETWRRDRENARNHRIKELEEQTRQMRALEEGR